MAGDFRDSAAMLISGKSHNLFLLTFSAKFVISMECSAIDGYYGYYFSTAWINCRMD
jgi:hypothetical protein